MRFSAIHLLLVVILCVPFLQEADSVRRKKRCFIKLCLKCQMYISHARGKRSILDGENELDSPDDVQNDGPQLPYPRRPNVLHWTERNSKQMDIMLREERRDEFDNTGITSAHVDARYTVGEIDPPKSKARHRKRSVSSYIERCIHLLSRCCRGYPKIPIYIGYKVKKH